MPMNLSELSTDQLKRALEIKEQIDALKLELGQIEAGESFTANVVSTAPATLEQPAGKRVVSQAARKKMAAAQKARWAKARAAQA